MIGYGLCATFIRKGNAKPALIIIEAMAMYLFLAMCATPAVHGYENITLIEDFDTLGTNGTFHASYPYTNGDDNNTATQAACDTNTDCGLLGNQTLSGNITAFTVSAYIQRVGSGAECGIAYFSYNNDSWTYACRVSACGTAPSAQAWLSCELPPDALNESVVQVQWYSFNSGDTNLGRLNEMNFSYGETFQALLSKAYDENTYSEISFNLTVANSTNSADFEGENAEVLNLSAIPGGSVTLTYSSEGYTERKLLATLADCEVNVTAYLIATGDGIYHSTTVLRQGDDLPIVGATVTVQKNIGGIYKAVEQHLTDSTGTAINYLDPTTLYHFVVSSDGYVSETFDIYPNPVSPIIYVRLFYSGAEGADYINFSTIFTNVSYQFLPSYYYQNDTFNASFEIIDVDSALTFIAFNATYSNGTLLCSEYVNDQPSGTLIECQIPYMTGLYHVQGSFGKPPYGNHTFGRASYWVFNSSQGIGSEVASAVSGFTYFMAALVIATLISAFFSRFSLYGSGISFVIIMAIAVAMNPALDVGGIPGWSIVGVMSLGTISIMFVRSRV